ncbi:MAG: hypothetical protein ABI969_07875, partial [bacterium]
MNRTWMTLGIALLVSCTSGAGESALGVAQLSVTPSITSITPSTYTTTTSLQTMNIAGSSFPRDATLTFVPPHGPAIRSTASRLIYLSSSLLSYKFNSGGDAGSWTVTVDLPNGA